MTRNTLILSALLLSLAPACGGGQSSSETSASAESDLTPMQELEGLSAGLRAELDALISPIHEVDTLISEAAALPAKLSLDAKSVKAVFAAKVQGTEIALSAEIAGNAEAKAEIDALLARLDATLVSLKATPERVSSLTAAVASATAKVPVLASKVTTSAQATLKNPFANAEAKVTAQAEIDGVAAVESNVQGVVQEVQQKATELPGLAAGALAKLSANFAS